MDISVESTCMINQDNGFSHHCYSINRPFLIFGEYSINGTCIYVRPNANKVIVIKKKKTFIDQHILWN